MLAASMTREPHIKIRAARRQDAAVIAGMAKALSAHEGKPAPKLTARAVRRDGFGMAPAFTCLLAECAERPVGYALFYAVYDGETAQRGNHLEDLFVLPEARGQGAGRTLVAALCRATRQAGGSFLTWHMEQDNHLAANFYQGLGKHCESLVTWDLSGKAFDRLAET